MLRIAFLFRCLYQGPTAAFAFMQQDMLEKARVAENFLRYEKGALGAAFLMRRVIHQIEEAQNISGLVKAEKSWKAI